VITPQEREAHYSSLSPDLSSKRKDRRDEFADELAAVAIYAQVFAKITSLGLAAPIEVKLAANAKKRPVEKVRGRAHKYTEL
jgi:NTP pyrophosphatase (non-canonical NTP hydrolase)